jgi:putative Holliday junction resolvase
MPEAHAARPPDVVLGFDFGSKRIGVAVGSAVSGQAQALTTLHHSDGPDWDAIGRLVMEWRPQALVVGLPLMEDGREQPITGHARWFMGELGKHFGLPVHEADERFSSIEAWDRLRLQRATGTRRKRLAKGDSDAMAAQVILEGWLQQATDA